MLLWCWRRLLRVSWTARRSNQSILKEISPEYSLEGLILKLKLQYFGVSDVKKWLLGKDPDAGKDWRQEEKGMVEDEMVGWHHRLNGHEFEQAPGIDNGQRSLVCCIPWGYKELDMTEWLNPLATWYEELTHWKRPWCWERLKARREGNGRGWDGWMASPTKRTWIWASSGSWWWTRKAWCAAVHGVT